jgi:hypothetical protein
MIDRQESRFENYRESQVHPGLTLPGTAPLPTPCRLVRRNDHGTIGRKRRLLAEFQRKAVGRVTFRHKNKILTQEKGIGRDFMQGNFD